MHVPFCLQAAHPASAPLQSALLMQFIFCVVHAPATEALTQVAHGLPDTFEAATTSQMLCAAPMVEPPPAPSPPPAPLPLPAPLPPPAPPSTPEAAKPAPPGLLGRASGKPGR